MVERFGQGAAARVVHMDCRIWELRLDCERLGNRSTGSRCTVSKKLVDEIDWEVTGANTLTAGNVELVQLPLAVGDESIGGMELLRDVTLNVTVELGRTKMNIGEVMELGVGSVVELDKMAGEPVDIRINGVLMATGEVIVLDDVFGVRITRLRNRVDRLQAFN